jgi:DNA-binding transcriptional ArsR family regulator
MSDNQQSLTDSPLKLEKLSNSSDFYNNVFKRTERIVSVMFYILSYSEDTPRHKVHIDLLTTRGLVLFEQALGVLPLPVATAADQLATLQLNAVALESALKMATAARVLTDALAAPLLAELDLLERFVRNHYLEPASAATLGAPRAPGSDARRAARPDRVSKPRLSRAVIPPGDISSDAHLVYSQLATDRAERILTVLEAKPAATIKDIAEVITDVSEKTIQRELNSLIEKGQVIREGERRWSRYTIKR